MEDERDYSNELYEKKKSASQEYFKEDFDQYIEFYNKLFNWKAAFFELRKITTNKHVKELKSYNSFHTRFIEKHPQYSRKINQ